MSSATRPQVRQRAPYAIRLPGPGLGEVAVTDVVEFLRGVVDLVAYAAGLELAKPVGLPGRRGAAVEDASKLRLVALTSGSLVAELAPAPAPVSPDTLGLVAPSLSDVSLRAVFDAARGDAAPPDLADALIAFAMRMSSRRSGAPVVLIERTGPRDIEIPLDERAIDRLRTASLPGGSNSSVERVVGRLFEANVEANEAHVRTPAGESVRVQFEAELEPEIKRLLGDRASLVGEVEYDARTHRVREIKARSVDAGEQLEFDGVDFWRDPSLTELSTAVAAAALVDPDELHIDASHAEWDDLYRVLADAG